MELLLILAILVALLVVPVMLAARLVGAGKTGFGSALLAVVLQVCLSGVTQQVVASRPATLLIGIVVGSAIFALVLDTTWLRGVAIGLLSAIIGAVVAFLLASSLANTAEALLVAV